jgi:hypothetical protein
MPVRLKLLHLKTKLSYWREYEKKKFWSFVAVLATVSILTAWFLTSSIIGTKEHQYSVTINTPTSSIQSFAKRLVEKGEELTGKQQGFERMVKVELVLKSAGFNKKIIYTEQNTMLALALINKDSKTHKVQMIKYLKDGTSQTARIILKPNQQAGGYILAGNPAFLRDNVVVLIVCTSCNEELTLEEKSVRIVVKSQ